MMATHVIIHKPGIPDIVYTDAQGRTSPEATAFFFGAMLQREFGNNWPRLIGIASQAAMNADHGIVDPCFSPADMG